MVKFKFFVHCSGWTVGGYENTHFAENAKEAEKRVAEWNALRPGGVSLLEIVEISDQEFLDDFIGGV